MTAILRGRGRPAVLYGLALALATGTLMASGGAQAPESQALTPPVSFTADELPTYQTNGIVWALSEANGAVFAGGTFSAVRPPGAEPGTAEEPVVNFVALDGATGQPLDDCQLEFTNSQGAATVRALDVSPDRSTLFAGGSFSAVNGTGVANIAAIDLETCQPQNFPLHVSATVRALKVTDDTVYLGGDFNSAGGETRNRIAAANHSGALLPFTAQADATVRAIETTPDGEQLIMGGYFDTVGGVESRALAVVDAATGEMAHAYPPGFIEAGSVVHGLAVDDTGFYTANEGTGPGVFDGRIALDLDTFEQRWRDTCLGATQDVLSYEDVLYSAHHAHDCADMGEFPDGPRFHFFAQRTEDASLLGWFPDTNEGLGEAIGPRALQVVTEHPDDDRQFLWAGGEFTRVNGVEQWSLTRFASSPDTGAPERPAAHAESTAAGEIELTWQSSLDTDDSLLTYHVYRDGASEPVHTVRGESLPWRRPQLSFTDTDVTAGVAHSYQITATDGAGNTSPHSAAVSAAAAASTEPYVDAVLADDPVLYWRFDERSGFFASDTSGNGNNGVHRGNPGHRATPPAVPGPDASGVSYTGSDQTYTYSDQPFDAPESFTVETWFRTSSTEGGKIIGFARNIWRLSTSHDKHVYMGDDGRLNFGVNATSRTALTSPQAYNDGEWHHLAAAQDSDGMRLYVDGELVAENSVTGNQSFTGYWRTGGDNLVSWPDRPSSNGFAGQLDETAVYHHGLSGARIAAHYAAASAPGDTTTEVAPSADTYVNQHAPGTSYGGSTKLASRGDPGYAAYLRFPLPDAPEGTVLRTAALRLTLTDDDYAGSVEPHLVSAVSGSWSEAATTWHDRPQISDETLGVLDNATTPTASYHTALDVGVVRDAVGGDLDLAIHAAGTDNLFFWSREAGAASRPALRLTFGAP